MMLYSIQIGQYVCRFKLNGTFAVYEGQSFMNSGYEETLLLTV